MPGSWHFNRVIKEVWWEKRGTVCAYVKGDFCGKENIKDKALEERACLAHSKVSKEARVAGGKQAR